VKKGKNRKMKIGGLIVILLGIVFFLFNSVTGFVYGHAGAGITGASPVYGIYAYGVAMASFLLFLFFSFALLYIYLPQSKKSKSWLRVENFLKPNFKKTVICVILIFFLSRLFYEWGDCRRIEGLVICSILGFNYSRIFILLDGFLRTIILYLLSCLIAWIFSFDKSKKTKKDKRRR
jgi:uncharacterized BrkB/YihY/UPF0761 family membrane protein